MKKRVMDILKNQVKAPFQEARLIWNPNHVNNDIADLNIILERIKNNTIRFQSDVGCNENKHQHLNTGTQIDVLKKRGRPTKVSSVTSEPKSISDSSDTMSLNDSITSTSSTRSRRAAAQAAEHKLAQVQSLSQLKTKLRRPTDFDEKQSKAVSSPPAKCRRTQRNLSAGSSSPHTEERTSGNIVDNGKVNEECPITKCSVVIEKMNTPVIKSYTHPTSRSSRSLDRASKKRSNDLFHDSNSDPEPNKHSALEASNVPSSLKTNKNKPATKHLDSGISSTEEEIQQLLKANIPIAHSSPISLEPFDGEFKGFAEQPLNNKHETQATLIRDNTFVVGLKAEKTQVLLKKAFESQESSCEEMEIVETNITKSKTKIIRKKGAQTAINVEEKENLNKNNETHVITSKSDDSPSLRSRTKILKTVTGPKTKTSDNDDEISSENDSESISSPDTNMRSRTKTIKPHSEPKEDSEIEGRSVRSRTKTIKTKNEQEDQSDEANNTRSRTKTIRKGNANIVNGLDSEYLVSEFKDNAPPTKMNNRIPPLSPAPAKGELVKKIVEDFEKKQNEMDEVEESRAVGRVTRNAVKNKTSATTEAQSSKQVRAMMQLPASLTKTIKESVDKGKRDKIKEEKENIPVARLQAGTIKQPLSSERTRVTPLGVNNRMTPVSDSNAKVQANKWTNSAARAPPVETNLALIQKQATEEAERKKKEEERLMKRQVKEEDAKKKKEKVLKATAEEARRKRVEKLQKVAATREAAEKEKERIAAKAEKEKEEKMRQIAIEKEKQREEHLKKKQLLQQKTLEHEERRKQEEAARLAKIKEQEEEHKRLLAMKEREQELQKQQKAEMRLAEAEKTKNQAGKLGKIAALNNAKLQMQGTPMNNTNATQSSNCYEITPAREDRALLPPKTENDYGIDDAHSGDSSEDESQPKKVIPAWAQSKNRERLLMINKYIPKKLWDMFMECDPCPDINKMFAGNPIKRRIRTSSAVWRTPPKYSRAAN